MALYCFRNIILKFAYSVCPIKAFQWNDEVEKGHEDADKWVLWGQMEDKIGREGLLN